MILTIEDTLEKVASLYKGIGSDILFFRGHGNSEWKLEPGLARIDSSKSLKYEEIAYYNFITKAGSLIEEGSSPWNVLFLMQHHGIPTRLLDWTESFAAALYFALNPKYKNTESCVWVLNPFKLNLKVHKEEVLYTTSDFDNNYKDYFINKTGKFSGEVIAMSPLRHQPRVFNQKSGFTLHNTLETPLEDLCTDALTKIAIPTSKKSGAEDFLRLSGVDEFSLFPDLDGLSRLIKKDVFHC